MPSEQVFSTIVTEMRCASGAGVSEAQRYVVPSSDGSTGGKRVPSGDSSW
jgi:hypothetical protein